MRRHTCAATVALAVAAGALVAGCAPAPAPGAGDPEAAARVLAEVNAHNPADEAFVQDMIPHHAQGVQLAALVPDRSPTPAVRDLAALIDRQQGFEIEQLRGMLTSWSVPAADPGRAMDMTMTGIGMGMAAPDTLDRLRRTRGAEFDRLWLQAMIRHHEGAVTMARTEVDAGTQRGARNIARNVVSVQQTQIATMDALLRTP